MGRTYAQNKGSSLHAHKSEFGGKSDGFGMDDRSVVFF